MARAQARAVVNTGGLMRSHRPTVDVAFADMYPALKSRPELALAEEAPHFFPVDGRMDPKGYALIQRMRKVRDQALVPASCAPVCASALLPKP